MASVFRLVWKPSVAVTISLVEVVFVVVNLFLRDLFFKHWVVIKLCIVISVFGLLRR